MSDQVGEKPRANRWTPEELDRIESRMGAVEAKRSDGQPLTLQETACADALAVMLRAEAEARESFSAFYTGLAAAGRRGDDQVHLPGEVAASVNRWVESTRAWEAAVEALLATPGTDLPERRGRTGRRLRAALPALFRVPTAEPARDTLSALFAPHLWKPDESGTAILARRNDTQVRIECDDVMGFGPERAVRQIARYGASAAQTFLTMAGFWLQQNRDKPHETYLTAYASDLLRFQGRKETPRGGYHAEDILAKGRDVYVLSRISVPTSEVVTYRGGRKTVKTLSIGRLLSLESLDAQETREENDVKSVVAFRYHLGREVYEWVCGDHPRYAVISGKLLAYHPVRQKYQILLGFCLAYYDRVNRKHGGETRRISLPALLNLASLEVPKKRVAAFLVTIEDALNELARDGIIPGVRLQKPDDWAALLAARKTREIIARSSTTFPRLMPSREPEPSEDVSVPRHKAAELPEPQEPGAPAAMGGGYPGTG